jgi:hypothetical protein
MRNEFENQLENLENRINQRLAELEDSEGESPSPTKLNEKSSAGSLDNS